MMLARRTFFVIVFVSSVHIRIFPLQCFGYDKRHETKTETEFTSLGAGIWFVLRILAT